MNDAFDTAWELVKAPIRGTQDKYYDQAMQEGVIPARQVEKDRKGVWASDSMATALAYALGAAKPDEAPLVHYLPRNIEGVGDYDEYTGYGYYPFDIPAEHSQEIWRGQPYADWEKEMNDKYYAAMDADDLPLPKQPTRHRWRAAMTPLANEALERWNNDRL
jgi:hypothetical protein